MRNLLTGIRNVAALLAIAAALPVGAEQAEPAKAAPVTAPKTAANDTTEGSAPKEPVPAEAKEASPDAKPAPKGKSPDVFVPSEKISEDLAVSFPVDI
jgi:hypothetical protein